ncbi:hypothetical protein [Arthrobacter sp. ISL-95]|uniref:hypothetical protein n=1 Tax=Arthrobacter sp. ISL-95 TaxID=2819116 RepID=UPI001BE9D129|nr:hypothetical protein [Arthrobacter sp. ISL-95]MBT2587292.1 hypothetical protein [Arthrobacter sp. ISL-95]
MPSSQSIGDAGNPYLYLGGLSEALDILIRKITSQPVMERLLANFGSASYTAEPDRGTSGAILVITATANNPEEAMALLKAVMDETPRSLNEMQESLNVAVPARITTMSLLIDRKAVPEVKARTQLVFVAGAGGLALTLVLSVLVDGLMMTRTRKKEALKKDTLPDDETSPMEGRGTAENAALRSRTLQARDPIMASSDVRPGASRTKQTSQEATQTHEEIPGVLPLSSGSS